jgi:AcrR family transcriptional regulator
MFSRSLDDARVQDITDLADVGKGTFFNFFSTKELIIPEVMRERIRQLRHSVDQVKAGQLSSREVLNYLGPRGNLWVPEGVRSERSRVFARDFDIPRFGEACLILTSNCEAGQDNALPQRVEAAGSVDAQNAPTRSLENREETVFHKLPHAFTLSRVRRRPEPGPLRSLRIRPQISRRRLLVNGGCRPRPRLR